MDGVPPAGGSERLLFICLQGLGNLILAEPAVRAARERHPGAAITVLVRRRAYLPLVARFPARVEAALLEPATVARLAARRFHVSYTCFPANDARFDLVTRLLGARERVGHRYPLRKRLRLPGTYTREVAVAPVDDVRQNLALVGEGLAATAPRLRVEPAPGPAPLLGIHPGSSTARRMGLKRWPAGHFRALVGRALEEVAGLTVWLFAGPGEEELAAGIAAGLGPRVEVIAGHPLVEVAELLAACTCVVANDSGLMHLAAAVGTPTVGLFGPTDPARTAPAGGLALQAPGVACAPCWPLLDVGRRPPCPHEERLCLVRLTPDQVWAAVAPRLVPHPAAAVA
ncbi:MAG: glycosyltransferase family 9 protein [Nitrospirae bacterium]|nr:MAG: glycosyltransferase family 9 protein [Nitrospirota bacterium]